MHTVQPSVYIMGALSPMLRMYVQYIHTVFIMYMYIRPYAGLVPYHIVAVVYNVTVFYVYVCVHTYILYTFSVHYVHVRM